MGRTRDIIQEIADIRQRRQFGEAMSELPFRLFALEVAFKKLDKDNAEIARYFPVALVACVEGYFRMAIKDLVDAGEPYLTNAEKTASSMKLDFSVLRAIHGKTVTVGELVAHGVQLSKLEHVDGALSSLLNTSFLQGLGTITDRWKHEVKGETASPILERPDQVYADVARTFELRHIICHELASAYEILPDEIAQCFESCVLFLRAADEYISETLHPGAPLTQADMNIAAGRSLDEAQVRLAAAVGAVRTRINNDDHAAFDDAQAKWQHYANAWADFEAGNRATGGTIWPLIYTGALQGTIERRIEELNAFRQLHESR